MPKKKPTTNTTGVIDIAGSPVRKTNRFFIAIRSYGHCNENGKAVMSIECSTKKIPAQPDRPLGLFANLIENMLPVLNYSSAEAMKNDLAAFKKYVSGLQVRSSGEAAKGKL
jgi:hypothetical protein